MRYLEHTMSSMYTYITSHHHRRCRLLSASTSCALFLLFHAKPPNLYQKQQVSILVLRHTPGEVKINPERNIKVVISKDIEK